MSKSPLLISLLDSLWDWSGFDYILNFSSISPTASTLLIFDYTLLVVDCFIHWVIQTKPQPVGSIPLFVSWHDGLQFSFNNLMPDAEAKMNTSKSWTDLPFLSVRLVVTSLARVPLGTFVHLQKPHGSCRLGTCLVQVKLCYKNIKVC